MSLGYGIKMRFQPARALPRAGSPHKISIATAIYSHHHIAITAEMAARIAAALDTWLNLQRDFAIIA